MRTQSLVESGYEWVTVTWCNGFEMQYLEANTGLRHFTLSQTESAMMVLEVREGIEGSIHQRLT